MAHGPGSRDEESRDEESEHRQPGSKLERADDEERHEQREVLHVGRRGQEAHDPQRNRDRQRKRQMPSPHDSDRRGEDEQRELDPQRTVARLEPEQRRRRLASGARRPRGR
jgi:hypothetical protein